MSSSSSSAEQDFYLEALQNYLQSSEWKDTIRIFVIANCQYFSHISDYHPQQHVVWKTFQDIVENILQMALMQVGGSLEQLEVALDHVSHRPSRGPRDESIKDVLIQLQTCDDFIYFAKMMHQSCQEVFQEEGKVLEENPYDLLMRMGFTVDLINHAYDQLGKHASLEDIVMMLSAENDIIQQSTAHVHHPPPARHSSSGASSGGASNSTDTSSSTKQKKQKHRARDEKMAIDTDYYEGEGEEGKALEGDEEGEAENILFQAYYKFIRELQQQGGEPLDINEFHAKFVIAESIIASYQETQQAGMMDEASVNGSGNESMLDLVAWAVDMNTFQQDLIQAFEQDVACADMSYNHHRGLLIWYEELERTRQDIHQKSQFGDFLSDTEVQRMKELDNIASQHSTSEQALHRYLSRHEELRINIGKLYKKLAIVIRMHHLSRSLIEEVYFYLKEQLGRSNHLSQYQFQTEGNTYSGENGRSFGGQVDISPHGTQRKEESITKLSQSAGGLEVIQSFFDLHLLEDEQSFVKREINALLGSPMSKDIDPIQAMFQPDLDISSIGDLVDAKEVQVAESKHEEISRPAEDKKASFTASVPDVAPNLSEKLMQDLKEKHRNAYDQLKATLEANHLQQLSQLETRLLMRKKRIMQLKDDKAKLEEKRASGKLTPDEIEELKRIEDILTEEEAVMELLEAERQGLQSQFQNKKTAFLEGLKYKCLQEVKAARQYVQQGQDEVKSSREVDDYLHNKQSQLDEEAMLGLKERYNLEKQQLLQHFQQERARQQQRLKQRLEKKHSKSGNITTMTEEFEQEKQQLDGKLDRELLHSIGHLRESLLFSLGAVNLSPVLSDIGNETKKPAVEEDEAGYLDDPKDTLLKRQQPVINYVQRMEEMKRMYVEAGDKLQRDLLSKRLQHRRKNKKAGIDDGETPEEEEQAYNEMVNVVDQMIIQAFDNHVQDMSPVSEEPRFLSSSSASAKPAVNKKDIEERMKAGILDAFEQAKQDLQKRQDLDKQRAMDKLQQRRDQKQKPSSSGTSMLMEGMLEEVMDGYLQADTHQESATTTSTATKKAIIKHQEGKDEDDDYHVGAPVQVNVVGNNGRRPLPSLKQDDKQFEDEKSRIKNVHNEKEKQLVDDLYASMMDKKRKLEDRMRRKKEKAEDSKHEESENHESSSMNMQVADEHEEKKKIEQLEAAFHKVLGTLKHANPSTLDNMTPEQLISMMEKFAQPHEEHVVKSGSHSVNHSRPVSATDRDAMAKEAHKISTAFVEEQQKHDLMMKIQQARQKQLLQRKLWERNQARQQQQMQVENLDENHEDDDDDDHDNNSAQNSSIHIGQFQSRLKNLKPYSAQPAFKIPNMPSVAEPRASPMNQQKLMASRGLNLGPMMMRK